MFGRSDIGGVTIYGKFISQTVIPTRDAATVNNVRIMVIPIRRVTLNYE